MELEFDDLIKQLESQIEKLGLITIRQAADLRKVSRSAILQLIQRGRLQTKTVLGKQLVFKSEVENFTAQKPGPVLNKLFKARNA